MEKVLQIQILQFPTSNICDQELNAYFHYIFLN